MRRVLIAASIVAASAGAVHAQATNVSPVPGAAPAIYGSDAARESRATATRSDRRRYRAVRPAPRWNGRAADPMSPPMYHAGDPRYWR